MTYFMPRHLDLGFSFAPGLDLIGIHFSLQALPGIDFFVKTLPSPTLDPWVQDEVRRLSQGWTGLAILCSARPFEYVIAGYRNEPIDSFEGEVAGTLRAPVFNSLSVNSVPSCRCNR